MSKILYLYHISFSIIIYIQHGYFRLDLVKKNLNDCNHVKIRILTEIEGACANECYYIALIMVINLKYHELFCVLLIILKYLFLLHLYFDFDSTVKCNKWCMGVVKSKIFEQFWLIWNIMRFSARLFKGAKQEIKKVLQT